ncbi:osmoprotectant transport system permease protein [Anaerospora hongkongensis]|jgi:osmoprotectant transport system permease protein|uniref:Osmoprotectant transport system permease protein n=1 Tax=Anaerospora hongkongensis TaxID=244830 RepID=A0A4R1Q9M3_9FIRM|nr:ABC transporter permease [Anaerospora hongkongensis]TCL38617.1 osmoprotectant transport system permease protein [Anaerospora hongkongensis]
MLTMLMDIWQSRSSDIALATAEHLVLTMVALLLANILAIPLGVLLTRYRKWAEPIIGITAVFQTIPSLALLGLLIPLMGIGILPAVVALTIYGLLPILRNTYTGILGVNGAAIEAGVGMGMTSRQILFLIELPLARPIIIAGIRTATVLLVGIATLASLIGAGGLGDLIFRGISTANQQLILAGAIPAALLAICFDIGIKKVEQCLQPKGLQ